VTPLFEVSYSLCDCQGREEDLEQELSKLTERSHKLEEDKDKIVQQYKQEYEQLKSDRDETITHLQGLLFTAVSTKIKM